MNKSQHLEYLKEFVDLDDLFDFDRPGRNLKLKPNKQHIVDDLKAAVLGA